MIKERRARHKNTILLDCGDSFSHKSNLSKLRAKTSITGLSLLDYDALNIADGELSLGLPFLDELNRKATFPFLSSNIYRSRNNQPVGKEYLIKEFGRLKIGIIGLTAPEYFEENIPVKEELVIKDPASATRRLLAKIKGQVDLIILLSHLGKKGTSELVKSVSGIDVAIVGHKLGVVHDVDVVNKTIVVQSGLKGKHLGVLELAVDGQGSIKSHKAQLARITKGVPIDPEIADLVKGFEAQKRSYFRKKRAQKRRERELEEKAGGALRMTPEQFLEEMQKEDHLLSPEGFHTGREEQPNKD